MHLADSLHLTMEGVCAGKELAAVSGSEASLQIPSKVKREKTPS